MIELIDKILLRLAGYKRIDYEVSCNSCKHIFYTHKGVIIIRSDLDEMLDEKLGRCPICFLGNLKKYEIPPLRDEITYMLLSKQL